MQWALLSLLLKNILIVFSCVCICQKDRFFTLIQRKLREILYVKTEIILYSVQGVRKTDFYRHTGVEARVGLWNSTTAAYTLLQN